MAGPHLVQDLALQVWLQGCKYPPREASGVRARDLESDIRPEIICYLTSSAVALV